MELAERGSSARPRSAGSGAIERGASPDSRRRRRTRSAGFSGVGDRLAARIPSARKIVMNGVGHMSNMEDVSAFNSIVLDFLRGVESVRAGAFGVCVSY